MSLSIDRRIDIEIPDYPSVTSTSHQSLHAGPALSPSPPTGRFLSIIVQPSSSSQTSAVASTTALPSPSLTTFASQSNTILSSPISPYLDSDLGSHDIITLPLDVIQRQWEDDRWKGPTWQDRKWESERHLATRKDLSHAQEVPTQSEAGPSRSKSQRRPDRPTAAAAETSTSEILPRPSVRQEASVIQTASTVRNQFTYYIHSFLQLTSS